MSQSTIKSGKVIYCYYRKRFYALQVRLRRHVQSGRFFTFSAIRQHQLLSRLQRYARQLGLQAIGLTALLGISSYQGISQPMGPEFRVNAFTGGDQAEPAVASNAEGAFVIVYSSEGLDGPGFGVARQLYDEQGTSIGGELIVNSHITGNQSDPAVAMDTEGNFVVVWRSEGQDGSSGGIYAQRFSALGISIGSEFQVNTYTTSDQTNPAIAMDADGDFVIVWESFGQDGSESGVYAQRYNAMGISQGPEFQVNTYTTMNQSAPSIAMDADGDFVITWNSFGQDGSGHGVYAQRYDGSGNPQGIEFKVNFIALGAQRLPQVAMDEVGNFFITWETLAGDGSGYGIYGKLFTASGSSQGGEFRINTYTTDDQRLPAVAMDVSGDFVVTWRSSGQDGSETGVYAQRFDATRNPVGSEFRVNSYTTQNQTLPAIAIDADGDFVIAWRSSGQDGSGFGIYAQRYITGFGEEFQVNTHWTSAQATPSVAMDADGDFVITWVSYYQDGSDLGVYAQRYDAFGRPQGSEFQVNIFPNNGQFEPQIAMDADGDFVIAWYSKGQDGDGDGIYARRFDASGNPKDVIEFRVNTHTTGNQRSPSVAMDAGGDFIITWSGSGPDDSSGIYARRYDASGNPKEMEEFLVNTHIVGDQETPSVAMDADGDFVITWSGYGSDPSYEGIYARQYNASGIPEDDEFQVNSITDEAQFAPSIGMDADGDFIIAFTTFDDGAGAGVYAQRYNAMGIPQNPPNFRVNTTGVNSQNFPSVAMDGNGDFVITWTSFGQDGYYGFGGIFGQRYRVVSGICLAQGSEFQVNTYTTENQRSSSISMDSDGDFVITWQSYGQDGSLQGVFAQQYAGKFPSSCESTALDLAGKDIGDKNYMTQSTISTAQNVLDGAYILYESPIEVTFDPNFEAQTGAGLRVRIDDCNN